jgi:hypothetical protein
MSTSGRGGTIQVGTLVSTLVSNAEIRARLREELTLESFLREIDRQVDELRDLAAGESVTVPAAIGLGAARSLRTSG